MMVGHGLVFINRLRHAFTEFDHLEFVDLTLFIGLHREIDHGRTVNLSCADLLFTHNGTLPTLRGFMRGPAR